jgi:hypothetical protein
MRLPVLILCLLMAACAPTPEQQAQNRQWELNTDAQQCASYGLQPNTEAFAQCRMELDIARQQRYYPSYYDSYPRARMGVGYYHHRW